jgi:Tetracyclin repressor-like, C-terminal domain
MSLVVAACGRAVPVQVGQRDQHRATAFRRAQHAGGNRRPVHRPPVVRRIHAVVDDGRSLGQTPHRLRIPRTSQGRVPAADLQADDGTTAQTLAPILSYLPPGIPASLVQRALMVWTALFGTVSFELYGQLHQVVADPPADRDAFFATCIRHWIDFINLRVVP